MTYVVSAIWTARPDHEEDVRTAIAQLIEPSRAEEGNILYQPHSDPENSRRFYFYEQYADEAAYEAHIASEHFQRLAFGTAIPLLESRERAFYQTWDPGTEATA
jgi:quinol monooxygenase YgiN